MNERWLWFLIGIASWGVVSLLGAAVQGLLSHRRLKREILAARLAQQQREQSPPFQYTSKDFDWTKVSVVPDFTSQKTPSAPSSLVSDGLRTSYPLPSESASASPATSTETPASLTGSHGPSETTASHAASFRSESVGRAGLDGSPISGSPKPNGPTPSSTPELHGASTSMQSPDTATDLALGRAGLSDGVCGDQNCQTCAATRERVFGPRVREVRHD